MGPRERRRRAVRAIRAARQRRGLQRDEHVERVVGSLAELQESLRLQLQAQPSEFEQIHLRQLLGEVDEQITLWQTRARGLVKDGFEAAWELAPALIDAPFAAVGSPLPRLILPSSLLDEMMAEGVSLMDGVGEVARTRIHQYLEAGLLGGRTPGEVMLDISGQLRKAGPFKLISYRAEAVTRTEMGRVHSKAGQARMDAALDHVPSLGKQWIWSGKGRVAHQAANNQVRAVREPFDVGGEQLQHPRDPAGSAANTIMCGCDSVPHMDHW